MKTNDLPEIMTTKQVCAYLRVSEKVLRRLRAEGRIKLYDPNPLLVREFTNRYRREDVLRLKAKADERLAS